MPDFFPDPANPPDYPATLDAIFEVQDVANDQNQIPPFEDAEIAQATEWNRAITNLVDMVDDIRTGIIAGQLDPDTGDSLATLLARRSNFLTKVITGYDGNPNDGGAPAIIAGANLGTWFREETATKWWRKTETVWEDRTITGGGGGGRTAVEHVTGELYISGTAVQNPNSVAPSRGLLDANNLYSSYFPIPADRSYKVAAWVMAGPESPRTVSFPAGSQIRLVAYAEGSGGRPGALLFDELFTDSVLTGTDDVLLEGSTSFSATAPGVFVGLMADRALYTQLYNTADLDPRQVLGSVETPFSPESLSDGFIAINGAAGGLPTDGSTLDYFPQGGSNGSFVIKFQTSVTAEPANTLHIQIGVDEVATAASLKARMDTEFNPAPFNMTFTIVTGPAGPNTQVDFSTTTGPGPLPSATLVFEGIPSTNTSVQSETLNTQEEAETLPMGTVFRDMGSFVAAPDPFGTATLFEQGATPLSVVQGGLCTQLRAQ